LQNPATTAAAYFRFEPSRGHGDPAIIKRAISGQPQDDFVDLVRTELPPCEPFAQLDCGQIAPGEECQGSGVGVHSNRVTSYQLPVQSSRDTLALKLMTGTGNYDVPNLVISGFVCGAAGLATGVLAPPDFPNTLAAIWSRARSEVVDTPCTLSLNSSTFDAQRSASS
jgi:hypothetical protein